MCRSFLPFFGASMFSIQPPQKKTAFTIQMGYTVFILCISKKYFMAANIVFNMKYGLLTMNNLRV
jgi:hypothetical protein